MHIGMPAWPGMADLKSCKWHLDLVLKSHIPSHTLIWI
jgi:hypothetical protein